MLINCVAYQEGKKLNDISIEEISDYLTKPDCFVWVALKDAELNPINLRKNSNTIIKLHDIICF